MSHPTGKLARIGFCFALGVTAAGPGQAAVCVATGERSILEARVLQSHLMVAALACGQRDRYNAFVERFRSDLVSNGRAVRLYFRRSYGGAAETEIDRFVTRLANQASARSLAAGFCTDAATLFARLEDESRGGLAAVAADQPFADSHGIAPCRR